MQRNNSKLQKKNFKTCCYSLSFYLKELFCSGVYHPSKKKKTTPNKILKTCTIY